MNRYGERAASERGDAASQADYERLRRYVGPRTSRHGAVLERPAAFVPPSEPPEDPKLSVMEWLLGVGHVVARKLRGTPPSAMVRLHPKR